MSRKDRGDEADDLGEDEDGTENVASDDGVSERLADDVSERPADETAAAGTEWRFRVDEVGPDGVTEDTSTLGPIEPGDIQLEHAIFVVAGVALAISVLLTAVI